MELADNYLLDERLRIKRRLGEGGFGTVYEARDEHLHRTVAVKVLKDSVLHDPSVRKRFLREGKILAQVQSEYLVRLFSINISSKGFLYMVMELAEGTTLRSELNEHDRLSESDTLQVARGIALGLKALSSYGVVHRDLKPDNIMLLRTANDITTKVLDFGLSGLINKVDVKDSYVTASGTILGSVHYIAPEACMGEKATFQSDCYALGCVIYECLVGTPPFMANDPAAVVFKHVSETPIDPVESCPNLGKGIRQLLTQLLQKDPSLRFESADDLLAAIDLCIDGEVPAIKSGGALLVAPAAARLSSRLKMLVVVGGILVFCGSIAGYFYVRQQQQNRIPEINSAEVGGNQILKLCEQVRSVKPDGSLSYQQSTQLLERLLLAKNVPANTISDLRAQIAACDRRLESGSSALIKAVEHKANGLSPNQYDAILKTGAKLKLIKHEDKSQAIFAASLSCLARIPDHGDTEQTNAQLANLLDIYLRDGAVEPAVLDLMAAKFSRTTAQLNDGSDLCLCLRLAHAFSEQKRAAPTGLRVKIASQLDAARTELLGANQGLLVQQIQDTVAEGNCDAAKHFALANLRGLKATKPPGEIAPACFAMGCLLSTCDTAEGAEFFRRAMLFAEQGHRVDGLYLNSMINYARYLNGKRQFDKARPLVWKIHGIIASGVPLPDEPKVGWMQLALGLPLRSDHLRAKNVIEKMIEDSSSTRIRELQLRTDAMLAYGTALDSLDLHEEACRVLAPAYQAAKKGNVKAVTRHSALRLYALELRRSKNIRALEAYRDLFLKDAYSQAMVGVELAGLYAELADVQKYLLPPEKLNQVVVAGLPDYYSCLEKSLSLRGLSQPWCKLHSKAVAAFHAKNYDEARASLLSLTESPETKKLNSNEIRVRLIECQMALKKEEEALQQADKALLASQDWRTCRVISGCYFAAGQYDKGRAAIEKCLLAYASTDLARKYAHAQTLLARGAYAEAEAALAGLSEAIENELPKEYVDQYRELIEQCREKKSRPRRSPELDLW